MSKEYLAKYNRYIEITTVIGCPNDCAYCPQDLLKKSYKDNIKLLSLEDFKLILRNIPKNIQLDFGGMSEPFTNPQTADMILYADQMGYEIMLYTTLRNFSINDIYKLKNIKFLGCVVHTVDKDNLIKNPVNEEYLAKIKLLKELNYSNLDFMVIGNPRQDIEDTIGQKLQTTKILLRGNQLNQENFVNISKDIIEPFQGKFKDNKSPLICGSLVNRRKIFRPTLAERTVMLPNGDVTLCCMDYALKHTLGNLKTMHYNQIINSKAMKKIEQSMLGKNDDYLLCRDCEWAIPYNKYKWLKLRLLNSWIKIRVRSNEAFIQLLPNIRKSVFSFNLHFGNIFKINFYIGN